MGDYIPRAKEKFVAFSQQFVCGVAEEAAPLNLATAVVTALQGKQTAFMDRWSVLVATETCGSVSAARKALVDSHRSYIRDWFNKNLRYNDNLTNTIRACLGVRIPAERSSHIAVGDRLVGFELMPKGSFMVGIRCWDEKTGAKRILNGMGGIVVLYTISDKPVANIDELSQSMLITKTAYTIKATDTQRGKWISATVCWQSKTGERGQCAVVQSAIIP
jgi:hypothetical protein